MPPHPLNNSDPAWDFHEFYDELLSARDEINTLLSTLPDAEYETANSSNLSRIRLAFSKTMTILTETDEILEYLEMKNPPYIEVEE